MAVTALVMFGVYALAGFGIRTWLQVRATGDTGFRGISGRPGSAEWWAGVSFAVALVAALGGPVAGLAGLAEVDGLDRDWVHVLGVGVAAIGTLATVVTQVAMGDSWRIGVDEAEKTDLVTDGPFAIVRNPIFTAMGVVGLGLALAVPNLVALVGLVVLLLAIHLQVRVVEEPYLMRTHGDRYLGYAARVGRFLPRIGLLKQPQPQSRR